MLHTKKKDKCYLLLGEDTWSKPKFISEIKTENLPPGSEMMNYFEVIGKEVIVSKLVDIAETLPFFTDKKIIYIKDSGFFKAGKKEESEKFEAFIKSIPDFVILIIDEKEADKRSKLYKMINTQHSVIPFDYPGEDKVYEMLLQKAALLGLAIDETLLKYFLRNMPEDIAYSMGEFDKLADYVGSTQVTKKAIESVCVFSLEKRIFELVKKIAHRNANEAFQIYHTLIESKESPIGILVLVARQYRMMLQVKYLLKNKMTSKDIASKLKLPYFALKEITAQINLYSFKELEEILSKCLQTDKDIKSGKMESIKRVEVLIMECLI